MGEDEVFVLGIIMFAGGFSVAIVAIVTDTIRKVVLGRAKEQSRREIAAYVAEGSMSPDDAVRLMEADGGAWKNMKELVGRVGK